ncbi:MAG: hypothetical protein WA949_17700 [Phormidesmis sp.]
MTWITSGSLCNRGACSFLSAWAWARSLHPHYHYPLHPANLRPFDFNRPAFSSFRLNSRANDALCIRQKLYSARENRQSLS